MTAFSALWALHILSVIAFFTGLLFFVLFAVRTLKPQQLKMWGIWLMVGGALVCLFTIGVMGHPWTGAGMMWN